MERNASPSSISGRESHTVKRRAKTPTRMIPLSPRHHIYGLSQDFVPKNPGKGSEEEKKVGQIYRSIIIGERSKMEKEFLLSSHDKTSEKRREVSEPLKHRPRKPSAEPMIEFADPSSQLQDHIVSMEQISRPSSAAAASVSLGPSKTPLPRLRIESRGTDDGIDRPVIVADNTRQVSARELHIRRYGDTPKVAFGKNYPSEEENRPSIQKPPANYKPSDRRDVILLQESLREMLRGVKDQTVYLEQTKIIYMSCFNEILRQVSVHCQERGELLYQVWHGMVNTYERSIEAMKSSGPQLALVRAMDAENREGRDIPDLKIEEQNYQQAQLMEIIDSLRAQLSNMNTRLDEKEFDEAELTNRIESRYVSQLQKLGHDCMAYRDYLKRIDHILDNVREEYVGLIESQTPPPKGLETFSADENIQIIKLLVEKNQERLKEFEVAMNQVREEIGRMHEDIKSYESKLEAEKQTKDRLNRQLHREREQRDSVENKLNFLLRETKEISIQAHTHLPDSKLALPNHWIATISPLATQLDPVILEDEIALSLAHDILSEVQPNCHEMNDYIVAYRSAIRKRHPESVLEVVDQWVYNLLWTIDQRRWSHDRYMLLARLSGIFNPFNNPVTALYCESRDWMGLQTSTILHISEKQIPVLTVAGQVDYIDKFMPHASMICKNILLFKIGGLGISVIDRFKSMGKDSSSGTTPEPSPPLFPPIILQKPINPNLGASVDVSRFLNFCLDEIDYTMTVDDEAVWALYDAGNITGDGELTFLMFRSIYRLVSANVPDSKISVIFSEGVPGSNSIDAKSFQLLEKNRRFIKHIPKILYPGFERGFDFVAAGWNSLKDQVEKEIKDLKPHVEEARLTESEANLIQMRSSLMEHVSTVATHSSIPYEG
eukprot:TRINITY_DN3370_c0_g1_i19.p1 TRINITY_DN3370_c0_g1~~TRINITY_DN3370_c0_g1_i19.p1  ORF type:complete len:890 (-),score=162.51 TRINITY_DN3370_c0_g1_i19:61-2730(-)